MDKPLTSFTPLFKSKHQGFLRKPCLSIFLNTLLSDAEQVRELPFAYFAWLAPG
jgi:hypothetical protein